MTWDSVDLAATLAHFCLENCRYFLEDMGMFNRFCWMNAALTECSLKQVDKTKKLLKQTLASDVQTPQKKGHASKTPLNLYENVFFMFGPSGVSGNLRNSRHG